MIFVSALIGFIAGAVAAWTMVYAAPTFVWFNNYWVKLLYGAVGGGVIGGLIGSITGDPNRTSGGTGHALLVAAILGVAGGIVGASKGDFLFALLALIHVRLPFAT